MNRTLLRHQVNLQSRMLGLVAARDRRTKMARNATLMATASTLMLAAPANAAACGAKGTDGIVTFLQQVGTFLLFLIFGVFPISVLIGALMMGLPGASRGRREKGIDMVKWAFYGLGVCVLLFFGQKVALAFLKGASGGNTLSCDPGIKIGQ